MIVVRSASSGREASRWAVRSLLGARALPAKPAKGGPCAFALRVAREANGIQCWAGDVEHKFTVASPQLRDAIVARLVGLAAGDERA